MKRCVFLTTPSAFYTTNANSSKLATPLIRAWQGL
jgi:hypothetical protein